MTDIFKKLFSIQKSKHQKTYRFFGMKITIRNHRFMIREMYKWLNHDRIKNLLAKKGIVLPDDAVMFGDAELVDVALKDIRREWKGRLYKLNEVSPFKCLKEQNESIYIDYIRKHFAAGEQPSQRELIGYLENFRALQKSLIRNGYDPSKTIIVLDKNNIVIDGQRRACILMYLHGEDHVITVVREK